jgi:RNA polymerase sigma-70 factor (ECF subfamily)
MPSDGKNETILKDLLGVQQRAVSFAYAVLRDFHEAEDVYQEAATIVMRKADEFRGGSFEAWFWTILRNVVGTRIRKSKRSIVLADPELLERVGNAFMKERPAGRAEQEYLMECLERLTEKARQVLEWRFTEGASCAGIAQRLNRSIHATYSIIKRAKQAVQDCVQGHMTAEGGAR